MVTQLPDGVRLLRTLTGHDGTIGRVNWSREGRLLATPSMDGTVRIWDTTSGLCLRTVRHQSRSLFAAALDPGGRILATGSEDGAQLWYVDSGKALSVLSEDVCLCVVFSPVNRILATAGESSGVQLWELSSNSLLHTLTKHDSFVNGVVFDAEGDMLATGSSDGEIILWELPSARPLRRLKGHSSEVLDVAFHPTGKILASAGADRTIRLWDIGTGSAVSILEGHTDAVLSLSFSPDGRMLASNSADGTIRLWETKGGECRAVLSALLADQWMPCVAFHPHLPILAGVGAPAGKPSALGNRMVQLWELDVDCLLEHTATRSVGYKSAKIVLVGESGVGKTGLGWRLAHGEFVEHASTHGQQFWLLDELGGTAADGTERDAILWDLAGQPDYRLIHALYLDDADLALVLFYPTRDDDPLRGVEYWFRQLGHDRPIILVAARCDRGASRLTIEEIEAFCTERGILGYIVTSALRGDGLDELVVQVRAAIRWEEQPATVSPLVFKTIKDHVLQLREALESNIAHGTKKAIVSPAQLRARLQLEYPATQFTDDEILTAAGHLSNHGYVAQLRTTRGEDQILLAPLLLNNLAASMVLEARRNSKGLGVLEEQLVLTGAYHFPELKEVSTEEQEMLLNSAIAMFLERSICFRETDPLNKCSYLVFPELINLKKPAIADEQIIEDGPAYTVSGAVGNVYASLVVLLGYTGTFTRSNQWHNHARYIVGDGQVCALRVEAEREGELDFVLYFGATVEPPSRMLFQSLFESFLTRRDLTIYRYEAVRCAKGHQVNRAVVREQLAEGENFAFCSRCGQQVMLPLADTPITLTQDQAANLADQRWSASQRSYFEQALFRLTTYIKQKKISVPDCFISYAWGYEPHERWVEHELAKELTKAGITVILDRWENRSFGVSIPRFIERVAVADRVVVVGTPRYRTKYDNCEPMGFVVAAEGDLIGNRMIGSKARKETVVPILLDGTSESSFPPLLQGRTYAEFRDTQRYFSTVFDLILSLYQISDHNPICELRGWLDERLSVLLEPC